MTTGAHEQISSDDLNFAIRCYYCPGVEEPDHDVVWWSDIEEDYRNPDVELDYRAALTSLTQHTGLPDDALQAAITLAALANDVCVGITFLEGQSTRPRE